MITITSIITASLQAGNLYLINVKGVVLYPLMLAVYISFLLVELLLALNGADQAAVGLFCVLDLWAIWTAGVGWKRHGSVAKHYGT